MHPSEEKRSSDATIGAQLDNIRTTHFIGREAEQRLFEHALTSERKWLILNVHGPSGVGKSSLLDRFQHAALQRHVPTVFVDCRALNDSAPVLIKHIIRKLLPRLPAIEPTLSGCVEALHQLTEEKPLVLIFDSYDEVGQLNTWLRDQFFPSLPLQCLVVISGRVSLMERWNYDGAWTHLTHAIALAEFDFDKARNYLNQRGIFDEQLITRAWRYTGGQALALSLVADIVSREGPGAMCDISGRPEVINTLSQRWLQELPDSKLRLLVEAAAMVRRFNQDLLSALTDTPVSAEEFNRLTTTSLVRYSQDGWSLHSLVRDALARLLKLRSPSQYHAMRIRALQHYIKSIKGPSGQQERRFALHEFFYLLGDGLVKAALYEYNLHADPSLYTELATRSHLPELEIYMDEWRLRGEAPQGIKLELYDRDSQVLNPQWVSSEKREPDFLDFAEIIERMPGSIMLLRDATNSLRGMSIIFPINADTIDYLEAQPVTGTFLRNLSEEKRLAFATATDEPQNWFVRLIDVRDPTDHDARAELFRKLTAQLIQPARFIASTPLPFYQTLLQRFGFHQVECPPQYDFDADRPSPYYELDLRGKRLPEYLHQMIYAYTGGTLEFDAELTYAVADGIISSRKAAQEEAAAGRDVLTHLTKREKQVALAAVEGLPNCTIAARLGVSEVTVKKHMSRIFEKLDIRNRRELIKEYWAGRQE